jgi:hypothetical protein
MKTTKATQTITAVVTYTVFVTIDVPSDFNAATATDTALEEARNRIFDMADIIVANGSVSPDITDCDIDALND